VSLNFLNDCNPSGRAPGGKAEKGGKKTGLKVETVVGNLYQPPTVIDEQGAMKERGEKKRGRKEKNRTTHSYSSIYLSWRR